MMDPDALEEAIRRDGRYPPEAYVFLQRGLEFVARAVHGDREEGDAAPRHVSGQQLCEGLRELALRLWGPLAREVLARWNIQTTRDFGEMVFFLIRLQVMGKQDTDRIEDFEQVYDFEDAFSRYEISLEEPDRA